MSNGGSPILGALGAAFGGGLALAAGLAAASLDGVSIAVAATLYILAAALLLARVAGFHAQPRFGLANALTLARLVATCILTAFAAQFYAAGAADDGIMWMLFLLAAGALIVDGLDGFAARRLGLASDFGARFDMEVDALLILVLSVIAFAAGKAGPWVIAGGLLRYGYVLAALAVPALTRPLAPAWRRKVVAVIQGGTLTALLTPVIQPPLSAGVAMIALVLLVYSFGVDIVAQVRAP